MAPSPRKHLRRAIGALNELAEMRERYPDARAELVAAVGEDRHAAVEPARQALADALVAAGSGRDVVSAPGRPESQP